MKTHTYTHIHTHTKKLTQSVLSLQDPVHSTWSDAAVLHQTSQILPHTHHTQADSCAAAARQAHPTDSGIQPHPRWVSQWVSAHIICQCFYLFLFRRLHVLSSSFFNLWTVLWLQTVQKRSCPCRLEPTERYIEFDSVSRDFRQVDVMLTVDQTSRSSTRSPALAAHRSLHSLEKSGWRPYMVIHSCTLLTASILTHPVKLLAHLTGIHICCPLDCLHQPEVTGVFSHCCCPPVEGSRKHSVNACNW